MTDGGHVTTRTETAISGALLEPPTSVYPRRHTAPDMAKQAGNFARKGLEYMGQAAIPVTLQDRATLHRSKDTIQNRAKNEPHGAPVKLAIPDTIKANPGAVAEWKRMVKIYRGLDAEILNDLDVTILEAYCRATATFHAAERLIDEKGEFITNRNGDLVPNPAIRTINQQGELILKYANQLCISPAARAKMGLEKAKQEEEADPMARFLREHGAI